MENDRKIKSIVFGRLEGTNKRGRRHKEWMDNITEWCGASIQELYHAALEKQKWRRITRMALVPWLMMMKTPLYAPLLVNPRYIFISGSFSFENEDKSFIHTQDNRRGDEDHGRT